MASPKMEKTSVPGIYKRGSRYVNTWRHRGKQHKSFHRTLAEAREAKGQRMSGQKKAVPRVILEDYFEEWIESYAGRTARGFSETTRPEYERPIRAYVLPRWGAWKLADVEPSDVRELFGQMRRSGDSTSKIRKLRAALSAMFATAVDDGKLRSNPVAGVRIPVAASEAPEDDRAKALTRKEMAGLLAAIPDNWRLFFELLAVSGLRISEIIGLTWEHLDLGDKPQVKVREQFYRGKRKKLKSRDGRRDVPLSRAMAERLLAHRRDSYKGPKAPVFASKVGTPLIQGKVRERVLAPAAISVGLFEEVIEVDGKGKEHKRKRPTISFHAFRHTCASMLFEDGRNVKQVAEWLGHADPAFTLKTYIHLMDAGVGEGLEPPVVGNAWATRDPDSAETEEPEQAPETPDLQV